MAQSLAFGKARRDSGLQQFTAIQPGQNALDAAEHWPRLGGLSAPGKCANVLSARQELSGENARPARGSAQSPRILYRLPLGLSDYAHQPLGPGLQTRPGAIS